MVAFQFRRCRRVFHDGAVRKQAVDFRLSVAAFAAQHYIADAMLVTHTLEGAGTHIQQVRRRTLQEYRNNRVLPFILLGGKVLYPESGLRELLEANYRKPME